MTLDSNLMTASMCTAETHSETPPSQAGDCIKTQSAFSKQVGGSHYKGMAIQPIEFVLANDLSYCEANVIKYICRHASKGGIEDLDKVIHYVELLKEHKYGTQSRD